MKYYYTPTKVARIRKVILERVGWRCGGVVALIVEIWTDTITLENLLKLVNKV